MCGIVGYAGYRNAATTLVSGLEKLEYRGYDSAGVAVYINNAIVVKKTKGRIEKLKEILKTVSIEGTIGIAHTRWATHGAPSDKNSHPHTSNDGKISLVHNGIIENYKQIRDELIKKGYQFDSETDTEVVVHLIRDYYNGNILNAVFDAVSRLKGAYSLAIICADEPDRLIAVRKDSPLILGIGKNENFIASDIPAILEYTRDIYIMENGEIASVTADKIEIYDSDRKPVSKEVYKVTWNAQDATKGGYEHYMIKEIHDQPDAILNTLRGRLNDCLENVKLDDFDLTQEEYKKIDNIYIVACGTAYYAGLVGKMLIEKYSRKKVVAEVASEFRYNNPIIDKNTLFIAISQSGETADTLESLRLAKRMGARTLAIANVVGSSIAREADTTIYTWAGPEIAVASTKVYSAQLTVLYLLAIKLALLAGAPREKIKDLYDSCLLTAKLTQKILDKEKEIAETAKIFVGAQDAFFIGRGLDYCLAMEGSLKMKEISYIHAEAYQAGELKHGPIALLDQGIPVIALCTQKGEQLVKTLSNIKETKARGAYVVAITQSDSQEVQHEADEVIWLDSCPNEAALIPGVVVLQILAYYAAKYRGCDIDKPKNLAKSVTVE
ncbi:MAG TPA: glutamine--fructose-6-phosphate transaminase (isomerizing) [Clostridia bacterium]|jgi:glucosamine--fructose-6-phosphate aminotransferase (isomerizing)